MNKYRFSLPAAALAAFLQWTPAQAGIVNTGGCLADRATFVGQNCTSNDVTFVLIGLGTQTDGCVAAGSSSTGDFVSINMRAVVRNTTAQARYDIGLWFANDGDPNGDGALTGACGRETLHPRNPLGTTVSTCPPLDLDSGVGPYVNAETTAAVDFCGDLYATGTCDEDGDGSFDDSIMDMTPTQNFPCRDTFNGADPPLPGPDGYVNIPTCASWGNQETQVYMGTCSNNPTQFCQANNHCSGGGTCIPLGSGANKCDSEDELMNGTAAKCGCEDTNTDIPRPNLALSCSCVASQVQPDGFLNCTVSMSNAAPVNLAPVNTSQVNRLQAATAGFVRFLVNNSTVDDGTFNLAPGSPSNGTAALSGGAGNNELITWNPAGGRCASPTVCADGSPAPEANVVGPGESGTLSFFYTLGPNAMDGQNISLPVSTQWSNNGSSWVDQTLAANTTCDFDVSDTYALITDVRAYGRAGGGAVVEWDTASEVATLGFELRRLDRDAGLFRPVHAGLLPATQHAPGGHYRFVDAVAPTGEPLAYQIAEYDLKGNEQAHGPYRFGQPDELIRSGLSSQALKAGIYDLRAREPAARTRTRYEAAAARTVKVAAPASAEQARILVQATGLQFVSAESIADALGLPLDYVMRFIERNRFALTEAGRVVPWQPAPGDEGLYFYGQAAATPFSDTGVYWIRFGAGQRAVGQVGEAPAAGAPGTFFDTVREEKDVLGRPGVATDPLEDYWFWKGLIAGHATLGTQDFQFQLNDVAPALGAASLRIDLHGFNNPGSGVDQSAVLMLNGEVLGELVWTGVGPNIETVALDQKLLREGNNTLTLSAQKGAFFVQGVEIGYLRRMRAVNDRLEVSGTGDAAIHVGGFSNPDIQVWDITRAAAPVVVEAVNVTGSSGNYQASFQPASGDARYLVTARAAEPQLVPAGPNTLRDRGNAADYLIITSDELMEAADLLRDYRSNAYTSKAVSVTAIMDAFNHGNYDPRAIQLFLEYAAKNWALAPEYVVLLGKGSYDYRDIQGLGGNLVPPMMMPTLNSGLVPADNAFADFDRDGVPEMKIGRLPVLSPEEVRDAVSKLARRENSLAPNGSWTRRVLMVADNADSGGDFSEDSIGLAAQLSGDLDIDSVHLGVTHDLKAARSAIGDTLVGGVGLVNYLGHGGFDRFAVEGLLTSADLDVMGSSARVPFVTAFTCNIGLHAFPGFASLGENLVVSANNGATAVLAPSSLSSNRSAVRFGEHVLDHWQDPAFGTVGSVVTKAMQEYLDAGGSIEVLRVYSILGDPASPVAK